MIRKSPLRKKGKSKLPEIPEKAIQAQILQYLRSIGWLCYRMNSGKYALGEGASRRFVQGHEAGTPDILAIKHGECCNINLGEDVLFIEVKTEKGKLSRLQEFKIAELKDRGFKVIVARSVDDVIAQVKNRKI